jgi:hypothetical protein
LRRGWLVACAPAAATNGRLVGAELMCMHVSLCSVP